MNLAQFRREARKAMKNPKDKRTIKIFPRSPEWEIAKKARKLIEAAGLTPSMAYTYATMVPRLGGMQVYSYSVESWPNRYGHPKAQVYISVKTGKVTESEGLKGKAKKNPRARRNHHLVVGERVKLSAEGVRRFPSQITQGVTLSRQAKKQLRGTVTRVERFPVSQSLWGYSVKLEGKGPWLKRSVPMEDDWVVSAESTSRKWPGNHFEGVNPMAKKNPLARRNHHLVVGEKVKLSQRGMRAHWEKERSRFTERHQNEIRDDPEWASELFSLMKREATEWRGKVAKVDKTGYLIQFIMRNGRLAKKKDYHSDKDVVSASSTTRKWPGNHYEGVDPMAKKNGREKDEALAKKVIAEMRRGGFPDGYYGPSLWESFSESYEHLYIEADRHGAQHRSTHPFDGTEAEKDSVWEQVDGYYRDRAGPFRANNNGRERRNPTYYDSDGTHIEFKTVDELLDYKKKMGGVGGGSTRKATKKASRFGPLQASSSERQFKPKTRAAALGGTQAEIYVGKAVSQLLGGTKAFCGGKEWDKRSKVAQFLKLEQIGLSRAAQVEFLTAMRETMPSIFIEKTSKAGKTYYGLNYAALKDSSVQDEATGYAHILMSETFGISCSLATKNPYTRQITNAGPYLPSIFPYGQGGRPRTYAKTNPRKYGTKRLKKKLASRFKVFHADHGISSDQMGFIQRKLEDVAPQGFFIKQINLPKRLKSVPNAMYGPAAGDPPVSEKDVHYLDRAGRGWEDRMVDWPPRESQHVQAIGIRDGENFTLFTVYGGPLSPQHPDDPTNHDAKASRQFWSQHALSSQQWAKKNSSRRRLNRSSFGLKQDYPNWVQPQTKYASWRSDPEYAYEQFYRANPRPKLVSVRGGGKKKKPCGELERRRLQLRLRECDNALPPTVIAEMRRAAANPGPRGGYSQAERDALPDSDFLVPSTRSWPVGDRNHAKFAIQDMTRFHIPNSPTLIRRLAKFWPPTDRKNDAIWSKYERLRSKIAKKAGEAMPTVTALKKLAPRTYFKAAANRGRRR